MTLERNASSPLAGLARQGVRIVLGGLAAYLTTHLGAEETQQLIGTLEAAAFAAVNLGLAALGKYLRDRGNVLGEFF